MKKIFTAVLVAATMILTAGPAQAAYYYQYGWFETWQGCAYTMQGTVMYSSSDYRSGDVDYYCRWRVYV